MFTYRRPVVKYFIVLYVWLRRSQLTFLVSKFKLPNQSFPTLTLVSAINDYRYNLFFSNP